jgi:hypothetical protein
MWCYVANSVIRFGNNRIEFDEGTLGVGLRTLPARLNSWVGRSFQASAVRLEQYMKDNAPWTDRTGDARRGLAAQRVSQGLSNTIVLYHQVSYGIYLETRWDGKYAIIQPTIEAMGPDVMNRLEGILDRGGV